MTRCLIFFFFFLQFSRGLEIRTLKYFAEEENNKFNIKEHSGSNYLVHHSSGEFKLHLYVYKTAKFRGHDEVLIEVCDVCVLGFVLNPVCTGSI